VQLSPRGLALVVANVRPKPPAGPHPQLPGDASKIINSGAISPGRAAAHRSTNGLIGGSPRRLLSQLASQYTEDEETPDVQKCFEQPPGLAGVITTRSLLADPSSPSLRTSFSRHRVADLAQARFVTSTVKAENSGTDTNTLDSPLGTGTEAKEANVDLGYENNPCHFPPRERLEIDNQGWLEESQMPKVWSEQLALEQRLGRPMDQSGGNGEMSTVPTGKAGGETINLLDAEVQHETGGKTGTKQATLKHDQNRPPVPGYASNRRGGRFRLPGSASNHQHMWNAGISVAQAQTDNTDSFAQERNELTLWKTSTANLEASGKSVMSSSLQLTIPPPLQPPSVKFEASMIRQSFTDERGKVRKQANSPAAVLARQKLIIDHQVATQANQVFLQGCTGSTVLTQTVKTPRSQSQSLFKRSSDDSARSNQFKSMLEKTRAFAKEHAGNIQAVRYANLKPR
jgi:hypothetical protein